MSVLLASVLLALAWGAITGSFGCLNLLFGFVLAALALSLIPSRSERVARLSASGAPFRWPACSSTSWSFFVCITIRMSHWIEEKEVKLP